MTRLVVACLPALLLVQPREAWTKIVSAGSSKHPLPKAWQLLLASTGDGRPKVRKAAHSAVLQLCEGDCHDWFYRRAPAQHLIYLHGPIFGAPADSHTHCKFGLAQWSNSGWVQFR